MGTLERLGITPGSIVLDVGFRTLDELVAISRLVGEKGIVYGIEPDKSLVADAVAQLGQTRNIRQIVGNAVRIPLPDESVDMVLFKGTTHHVENHPEAIGEARRLCHKDGRIVIVDFMPFPASWLRWPNLKWKLLHPGKLFAKPPDKRPGFSEQDIMTYMRNLNMTLESYEPNFGPGRHSGHDVLVFLAIAGKVDAIAC